MQKLRITGILVAVSIVFQLVTTLTFVYAADEDTRVASSTSVGSEGTYLGEVIRINNKEIKEVPNTNTQAVYENITVRFITGNQKGKEVDIADSAFALDVGDKAYIKYLQADKDTIYYSVQEPYRIPGLIFLAVLFVIAVVVLGGRQGFLALIALFISFGVIFKLLFPQLLTGGNVVVLSTLGALLSLFVVMYLTHGFTRMTTAAFLGCSLAVLITVFLAKYAVWVTSLTGFSDEESVYLNIATNGNLDFVALLIGGIIIGVIGVVDDAAITQASVVQELLHMNSKLSFTEIYTKAIKVGKDHVGAVINTLILAYTGASLPLVLLLYTSTTPVIELINREGIVTEIVRAIVGSIGILCAVPVTTLIAIVLMHNRKIEMPKHTHHH